ncbi:MAG: autotransporter-associated beta strand repeat-containing protein [Verrucomicrobia bacterium]|nr:autotransporter-associated beta strand repeat-containing protein [Verrucomicrobiota bacterium]
MNIRKFSPSLSLGLKQIALVASIGIGATALDANAQVLTPKWQNTDITAGYRGIAYNPVTGNILVAQTTGNILRQSSLDGTSAGSNLDNTDVSVGTFVLSGVAVTKDGTIFACNYVTGAQSATPLKIYRWKNEDAVPELVTSLGTLPGATTDRFGAGLKVFTSATTTNLLIAGNATTSFLAVYSGEIWTFKQLTGDAQVMTPAGTFIDYNAPGFANRFRVVAKSRGSGGQLYNFDPTATSPISLTVAGNKTPMGGEWSFKANGITSHDYDPKTGLLGAITCTLQASSAFDYTNMIFSTTGGVASPVELSRVHMNATAADAGTAGGTTWGTDGRLYTFIPIAGAGLHAFDINAFLITAPESQTKVSGQDVVFASVFGGSALTYAWTKDGSPLSDSSKYSGTSSASLTVHNLTGADAGNYEVTATDANNGTAFASATLTMAPSKAWTGGGSDDNWSTAANWGGTALETFGDTAVFAGTTRMNPVMNASYDVSGFLFGGSAGAFNLTASPGNSLTLSGTLGNESAYLQTIAIPVVLNSPQTVDIVAPVSISGIVSGSGDLIKTGAGTLTLSGTNTLSGGINISGGTLAVLGGEAIPDDVTVTLGTGGVLSVDEAETIGALAGGASTVVLNEKLTIGGAGGTYTGGIAGAGDLEIATTGTQAINSASSYTGSTILTAGTLSANDSTTFGNGTGVLQFNGGTLFRGSQSVAQIFANPVMVSADSILAGNPTGGNRSVIFGAATITSTNGGALTVTNTAASGAGIFQVRLTHTSANSSAPIILGQGDFGSVELLLTNSATGTQVISGNISGNGKVIKNGTTTSRSATLSGNNSFSGGLEIRGGRVNFNHNNAAGTGVITVNSTAIALAATVSGINISNNVSLAANADPALFGGTSSSLELSGVISGADSASRLTRTHGGSGTVTLSGDNTFSGGVSVFSRTLALRHRNALGTGTLTIGDPTDVAASASVTISSVANLTGANAIANNVTVNTNFTVSASSANPIEFTGNLSLGVSGRGLTKTSTGVLTLSGSDNSYNGNTTVNAGALQVNGALTASPVTVAAAGTLRGTGVIYDSVTVNGTISPGANAVGTLTTGNQTWNGAGRYRWEMNDAIGGAGFGWDTISVQGALDITATSGSKFNIDIVSLEGSIVGYAANFDNSAIQSWTILTTTGGIFGFDPAAFNFVKTAFSNSVAGSFTLALDNNDQDLVLHFIPGMENFTLTGAGAGTFSGIANTSYTIQYTDSLNPINWQTLIVVQTDGDGLGSFADPGPMPDQRFYRITLP